jgi:inorganic pyrophosphatase
MKDDAAYGDFKDIGDCPISLIDRLQHYFLTYKMAPGSVQHKVEITSVYGREEAMKVILASHTDYRKKFPELESLWPKHISA